MKQQPCLSEQSGYDKQVSIASGAICLFRGVSTSSAVNAHIMRSTRSAGPTIRTWGTRAHMSRLASFTQEATQTQHIAETSSTGAVSLSAVHTPRHLRDPAANRLGGYADCEIPVCGAPIPRPK